MAALPPSRVGKAEARPDVDRRHDTAAQIEAAGNLRRR
jgi:hypothetical protein